MPFAELVLVFLKPSLRIAAEARFPNPQVERV
jgi:hypothetical protein